MSKRTKRQQRRRAAQAKKMPKPKRVQRPFHRPWRDPMAQAFKRAMADPDA